MVKEEKAQTPKTTLSSEENSVEIKSKKVEKTLKFSKQETKSNHENILLKSK